MAIMATDNAYWLGKVPEDWGISRIGDYYKLRNEKVSDVDFPPLSVTMKGIVPQLATAAKTDDHDNRKLVRKGDFAINSRSDRRGSCGISDYDGSVSLINTVLTPRGQMNPKYYNWLFHTEQFADEFYKWGHGIVDDLWTTRWQEMKSILIVSPPLAEQQAIADYLDDRCSKIDEIIAEATASIEEYKELKQAVITESVTKGLSDCKERVSDIPWIGSYNSNYRIARLGRFCFVTKLAGFEYTNIMADAISYDAEIPIVRAQNVKMFRFNNASISEYIAENVSLKLSRCALDKKALLITFIGAGIGDVCIFDEPKRYHLAPNVAKIEINNEYKDLITEEYLMYYLGSSAGQGEIKKISKASAQPSLSMETIRSISILIPEINEQNQISDYLDMKCLKIDSLISEKEQLIYELNEYKKSLIYEVVTGKKRVVV